LLNCHKDVRRKTMEKYGTKMTKIHYHCSNITYDNTYTHVQVKVQAPYTPSTGSLSVAVITFRNS